MRERERQTATKPRYYIRGIEITAQTGLGRFGGAGWPRPRLRAPSSCRPPGPRSCQLARYPRTTPRHFDGLSGRPRASVSRRSPRSRAHRGHRAGFVEVGSGGDQGQHIEVSAGHAHQLQGLGLGRTLQKIVGVIVGAASRAGREHLQGSSPPRSTNLDKIFDQALILWCGMVTCGRAESPVLGRDMGALGFKFPTTHRAYGGAGSELRRAEGGMVRSSEGTQRRSFSSLG